MQVKVNKGKITYKEFLFSDEEAQLNKTFKDQKDGTYNYDLKKDEIIKPKAKKEAKDNG